MLKSKSVLLSSCAETAALRDPRASDRGGWAKCERWEWRTDDHKKGGNVCVFPDR